MSKQVIPDVGTEWDRSSLLWGFRAGGGAPWHLHSPADGSLVQGVCLLSGDELEALTRTRQAVPAEDAGSLAVRLSTALAHLRRPLQQAMVLETGFTVGDCDEILEGCLDYLDNYSGNITGCFHGDAPPQSYQTSNATRQIRMAVCPWGTVAVILPQNAFLLLALTCLLNGVAAGNRVILRAPLQSARSAALLATALEMAGVAPGTVSVALVRAQDFVEALYRSPEPCLIHYLGGTKHAPALLAGAFRHGKGVLIDGEGNGRVYVGEDAAPGPAAELLTAGALRYNGQTCTSVNGAVIHPAIYPALRDLLAERWRALRAGNPLTGGAAAVQVGPLFSEEQAAWCLRQIEESRGTILSGGRRDGNLLHPTLVEEPSPDSGLVTEGLFGAALWIASGTAEDFVSGWRGNRYPLCAGVLSPSADAAWWLARLPNLARLTLNGDPSVESVFEPWGGYGASGNNPVGAWVDKYRRVLQVDEPFPADV